MVFRKPDLRRFAQVAAPMGPRVAWAEPEPGVGGTIVYQSAQGSNLSDVDGNRYVDLAMGFGVGFFGHQPPFVRDAIRAQLDAGFELATQSGLAAAAAWGIVRNLPEGEGSSSGTAHRPVIGQAPAYAHQRG